MTNEDYKWIGLGMCRSRRFLEAAAPRLTIDDIPADKMAYKILYKLAGDWYAKYKSPPPLTFMKDQLTNNEALHQAATTDDLNTLMAILEFSYDTHANDEEVKKLEPFLVDKLRLIMDEKVQRVAKASMAPGVDVKVGYETLRKTIARSSISTVKFIHPFGDPENIMLGGHDRIPWGVEIIDVLTEGGSTPGETTLILAPTSGGKTLLNVQLAAQAALNGEDSMIFSYEQNVFPQVSTRVYSYAMGLPIGSIQGTIGLNSFKGKPELVRQYKEMCARIDNKITIIDMLAELAEGGASGGASDIETTIMTAQDRGFRPRYIGVDWLGPMVSNWMEARGMRPSDQTTALNNTMDELRKIGARHQVNIFVYHQLGVDACLRSGFKAPSIHDAQNSRMLANCVETAICFGARDTKSDIAVANVGKLRNAKRPPLSLVKMEGSYSKFVIAKNAYISRDRSRIIMEGESTSHPLELPPDEEPEPKAPSVACTTSLL